MSALLLLHLFVDAAEISSFPECWLSLKCTAGKKNSPLTSCQQEQQRENIRQTVFITRDMPRATRAPISLIGKGRLQVYLLMLQNPNHIQMTRYGL